MREIFPQVTAFAIREALEGLDGLKESQVEMHIYEGVNHAFNNDTNAARYDAAAAKVAWGRTVEFLKQHLAA